MSHDPVQQAVDAGELSERSQSDSPKSSQADAVSKSRSGIRIPGLSPSLTQEIVRLGEEYMEKVRVLLEQHGEIITPGDKANIRNLYSKTVSSKSSLDAGSRTLQPLQYVRALHYRNNSHKAYILVKSASDRARDHRIMRNLGPVSSANVGNTDEVQTTSQTTAEPQSATLTNIISPFDDSHGVMTESLENLVDQLMERMGPGPSGSQPRLGTTDRLQSRADVPLRERNFFRALDAESTEEATHPPLRTRRAGTN